MLIRKIYYKLPLSLRKLSRRIISIPSDIKYYLTQPNDAMHPPKGKILIGSGDFLEQGKHQLDILKKYLDLKDHHHILDIGCGQGRTAVALTNYLSAEGRYHGIDMMPNAIDWCQRRIQSKYPHFRFHLIESGNQLYRQATGIERPTILKFNDQQFDKCFLFSVFTHLTKGLVTQYLDEISRVLKENQTCLCTMFIYDSESDLHISHKNDGLKFPFEKDGFKLMSNQIEEANVAYSKELLTELTNKAGITLNSYVEGYWKDWIEKSDENSFQDIIILKKVI